MTLPFFKNNSERLAIEFIELRTKCYILRIVICDIAERCQVYFNKPLHVTCIKRSEKENERVGGMPDSAHLDWRAADLRSRNFTAKQIENIIKFVKKRYGDMMHIIYHKNHIHININRQFWKR